MKWEEERSPPPILAVGKLACRGCGWVCQWVGVYALVDVCVSECVGLVWVWGEGRRLDASALNFWLVPCCGIGVQLWQIAGCQIVGCWDWWSAAPASEFYFGVQTARFAWRCSGLGQGLDCFASSWLGSGFFRCLACWTLAWYFATSLTSMQFSSSTIWRSCPISVLSAEVICYWLRCPSNLRAPYPAESAERRIFLMSGLTPYEWPSGLIAHAAAA